MKRRWKKGLAAVLSGLVFLSTGVTIYAEDEAKQKTPEQIAIEQEMAAAYAMPVNSNGLENWPQGPAVYAESAIVMDVNSGAILYAKNVDEKRFPASITKIMTALVTLENSQLTDRVKFTKDSISFLEYGDAHIGMKPGEEISMEDALYGMLLASANEVSHAIAENAGGFGYDGFIAKMNEKAEELGCQNTHFVNTNGLHDDNHYVSARDMAVISSAAFQQEEFRTVTKTLEHTIPPTAMTAEPRTFQQNHKMLYPASSYYYEYCVGGKTGYTDQSKTTLVTFADNHDMQLVAVNLKSHGVNVYTDTRAMFDYAYGSFSKVPIKEHMNEDKVNSLEDENAYVVLPNGVTFDQLIGTVTEAKTDQEGSREGILTYTYKDQPVGSAKVKLSNAFYAKSGRELKPDEVKVTKSTEKEKKGFPLWGKIALGAGVFVVAVMIVCVSLAVHRKKKRRKCRERRRRRS
ncbi:MAG: D-alanyl-D-alanine carboxypeptidase family protein [Lachnospiraceae bacterium]